MSGVKNFNAEKDIPSLAGKVIFVTGGSRSVFPARLHSLTPIKGTAGLGATSIKALAKHNPSHIYFSGRNTKRGQALIAEINKTLPNVNLTFIELDLSSLSSIKAAIPQFRHDRLEIFMGNAGIMAHPPGLSKDGYEIQFATNHLGHAMLIKELLPVLLKTAEQPGSDVRIVLNTSLGWRGHPKGGIQFSTLNTGQDGVFGKWIRYGQSKLANIVYAAELARRYPSLTCLSVHPGVIATELVTNLDTFNKAFVYVSTIGQRLTPEEGVLSQLYVAAGAKKESLVNGGFYVPVGVLSNDKLDKVAKSARLATDLWEWTTKALEGF